MGMHKVGYQYCEKEDVPEKKADEKLLKIISEILNEESFSSTISIA